MFSSSPRTSAVGTCSPRCRTCRPIPLSLGSGPTTRHLGRPALPPTPTSVRPHHLCLSGTYLSDMHAACWVIVQLVTHQGLCTARCQATVLPLSHLYSSLPPSAKPFRTTRDFGDVARRTSRGTPRTMWGRFLLYSSGSKQIPYPLHRPAHIWLIVKACFVPAFNFVPLV